MFEERVVRLLSSRKTYLIFALLAVLPLPALVAVHNYVEDPDYTQCVKHRNDSLLNCKEIISNKVLKFKDEYKNPFYARVFFRNKYINGIYYNTISIPERTEFFLEQPFNVPDEIQTYTCTWMDYKEGKKLIKWDNPPDHDCEYGEKYGFFHLILISGVLFLFSLTYVLVEILDYNNFQK